MKAIFAALALLIGVSAVATTGQAYPYAPKYGSIALNTKTGAYGYSYRYGSPHRARAMAQRFCRRYSSYPGCRTLTVFRNQCAALVRNDSRGNYGWAVSHSRHRAIRNAYYHCNRYGGGCRVKVAFCSR